MRLPPRPAAAATAAAAADVTATTAAPGGRLYMSSTNCAGYTSGVPAGIMVNRGC